MPCFSSRFTGRAARRPFALCATSIALVQVLGSSVAVAQEPAPEPAPSPAPEAAASAAPEAPAPTTPTPPSEAAPAPTPAAEPAPPAEPPKPPPYSLPFQLRPAAATTTIRYDEAFGFYEDPGTHDSGFATVPLLSFSYKVVKWFAPMVRLGVVSNSPPNAKNPMTGMVGPQPSGFDFLNPILGGTFALELSPELKLAFFLGFTIPVGGGGGNTPDPGDKLARGPAGIYTRNAMDNAMFAVNDFTVFPGIDFAFVKAGFTAQAEATLYQLTRVRGDKDPAQDASRTNLTMGLHAGYFIIPALSLGAEIRHQRWLSTPKSVTANPSSRDTTTIAVGPRFHFQVSKGKWLRPGIAFAFPLDDPMKKQSFKVVQLDIPFTF